MARMRTIRAAYEELHQTDSNCCISERYIRQLVKTGKVPSRQSGKKYLVDLDLLQRYLAGEDFGGDVRE